MVRASTKGRAQAHAPWWEVRCGGGGGRRTSPSAGVRGPGFGGITEGPEGLLCVPLGGSLSPTTSMAGLIAEVEVALIYLWFSLTLWLEDRVLWPLSPSRHCGRVVRLGRSARTP